MNELKSRVLFLYSEGIYFLRSLFFNAFHPGWSEMTTSAKP